MIDRLLDFFEHSSAITIGVIALLAIYFIAVNWIFFYRYFNLSSWEHREESSLEALLMGSATISHASYLHNFIKSSSMMNKELLRLAVQSATKEATKGLSFESIVASTAPFIGLFGTVVSILETFSNLGSSKMGGISVIASGVSEALIATAVGIFVAIFAYTFHQILKRKAFEIVGLLNMQSDALILRKTEED